METNLLDRMLDTYLNAQTPVTVTLQNKIRVTGRIRVFDSYVIIMDGAKREIVYRHAVSSITPLLQEEQRAQPTLPHRTAPAKSPSRPGKSASHKSGQVHVQALSAAADQSINNSMKEGLLRWMQEQKAAK